MHTLKIIKIISKKSLLFPNVKLRTESTHPELSESEVNMDSKVQSAVAFPDFPGPGISGGASRFTVKEAGEQHDSMEAVCIQSHASHAVMSEGDNAYMPMVRRPSPTFLSWQGGTQ